MAFGFELRLIGADTPDGEVSLATLAPLADRLQELAGRIGSDVLASDGSSRTDPAVRAALTSVRLVGLAAGSTSLRFVRGRSDDPESSAELDAKFWELLDAIAVNHRPAWVTDPIAQSAENFVAVLKAAAPKVELTRADGKPVAMMTATLNADVWKSDPITTTDDEVVITGRLEAVDLRSGRFRVVDDVSNRLILDQVKQPEAAAHLIGHRVRAVGIGIFDSTRRLKGAKRPTVEAQQVPASWLSRETADVSAEFAKPGPTFGGGVDLTDEEFADFMATIEGQ